MTVYIVQTDSVLPSCLRKLLFHYLPLLFSLRIDYRIDKEQQRRLVFQRGEGITIEGGGHGAVGVGCLTPVNGFIEIWDRIWNFDCL